MKQEFSASFLSSNRERARSVRNENRYKKGDRVDEEKTTVPEDPIERRSENGIQIGILENQAAVVGPQVAGRL